MEIERIFEKVAKQISPSPIELKQEKEFAFKVILQLEKYLPRNCAVSFVGSAARDTGLKGDRDIDLFVAFPRKMSEDKIVKLTFDAAKKAVKTKWVTHYAEHPYLQAIIDGFQVEVIPCFKVEPNTGIKSAVDRSPLHMDYLQKKLTTRQRRDVRVMKKLLKVNHIYGAEVEVGGFSGLVCEQLMLKYGDLENLLREAVKWVPPVIVDYEDTWNSESKQGKNELLHKFKDAKFILIDVIDRNRNAAAAVSHESLAKFILLARAFVRKPSESFFVEKIAIPNASKLDKIMKRRATHFVLVEMKKPHGVDDILYPQFKHSEKNVSRELQKAGFTVVGSSDNYKKGQMLFEVQNEKLAAVKKVVGPLAWDEANVKKFLKGKNALRGPYLEAGHIVIDVEQHGEIMPILKSVLKNKKTGVASHYIQPAKSAKIQVVDKANQNNADLLNKYLLEKINWV